MKYMKPIPFNDRRVTVWRLRSSTND